MQRITLLATSLITVALMATGCGSSSSSNDQAEAAQAVINAAAASSGAAAAAARVPTAGPKLTKPEYIAKADTICRQMVAVDARDFKDYSRAAKAGQAMAAAAILDRDTPEYSAWLGKLHALSQPKQDRAVLTEILGTLDNQAQVTGAQAAALRSTSLPALNTIAVARLQAKKVVRKLGKQYGFKVCGNAVLSAR